MAKKDIIEVFIKRPGVMLRRISIANTLEAFQEAVGGYIETYGFYIGEKYVCIICNENGKIDGAEFNFYLNTGWRKEYFVGTVVFVGTDEDEFCSVPVGAIEIQKNIREDIGAYYCYECGVWFDEPLIREVDMEELFGVGNVFSDHHHEKHMFCPFCDSSSIEAKGEFFR